MWPVERAGAAAVNHPDSEIWNRDCSIELTWCGLVCQLVYAADGGPLVVSTWSESRAPHAGAREILPEPGGGADLAISFELPTTAHGRDELLEVTGQRSVERDVSDFAACRYTEHLAASARLPPGMHWLRLWDGGCPLCQRRVVLRQGLTPDLADRMTHEHCAASVTPVCHGNPEFAPQFRFDAQCRDLSGLISPQRRRPPVVSTDARSAAADGSG